MRQELWRNPTQSNMNKQCLLLIRNGQIVSSARAAAQPGSSDWQIAAQRRPDGTPPTLPDTMINNTAKKTAHIMWRSKNINLLHSSQVLERQPSKIKHEARTAKQKYQTKKGNAELTWEIFHIRNFVCQCSDNAAPLLAQEQMGGVRKCLFSLCRAYITCYERHFQWLLFCRCRRCLIDQAALGIHTLHTFFYTHTHTHMVLNFKKSCSECLKKLI